MRSSIQLLPAFLEEMEMNTSVFLMICRFQFIYLLLTLAYIGQHWYAFGIYWLILQSAAMSISKSYYVVVGQGLTYSQDESFLKQIQARIAKEDLDWKLDFSVILLIQTTSAAMK